jgi:S-adenosylmethionine:tRNA ribosyltransferase-isomerase
MPDISDFSYNLPPNLFADKPTLPRDHCRLLTLNRQNGDIFHHHFYDLADLLGPNDVLVLNQSKVFPARLFGRKETGGRVEFLLLHQRNTTSWLAISSPLPKINTKIYFDHELTGVITRIDPNVGQIEIIFNQPSPNIFSILDLIGQTPIPPYIHTTDSEEIIRKNYQTVYAKTIGSAAAPTAGLHFTKNLLKKLKSRGVAIEYLTLHVGLGTFQKLRPINLIEKKLHTEFFEIDPVTSARLIKAKFQGKRIIAVGTTTLRSLESWAINPESDSTDIFIFPPYKFNFVDSLITNFHLPESSLLMLVSAFSSFPNSSVKFKKFSNSSIGNAYSVAISKDYRFFSFGDAMWIF